MPDFFQNGMIATLHGLEDRSLEDYESDLKAWRASRPMALVIPSLASELDGPALDDIVEELVAVPYLDELIIGLDRADEYDFEAAKKLLARVPYRNRILWIDGPRLSAIADRLSELGLRPSVPGKGRNVWWCLGYYLASGRAEVVALHDADILTYDRMMLARLLYPAAHPTFNYVFTKGFYYRSADGRFSGRVARLFVTPLVRALSDTFGPSRYLDYIDSFRYPLAGEVAMRKDVVQTLRMPSDWGLEIGVMSEVFRRYTTERICQVDLAGAYDHKHQEVSADDPGAGLHKMSIDIAKAMYRKLAIDGAVFSPETFRTIKATYYRRALDLVDRYHDDAVFNGLTLDRHAEEATVELFTQSIIEAGDEFLSNPMETPFIPSWSRVQSAYPEVLEELREAVEADNR